MYPLTPKTIHQCYRHTKAILLSLALLIAPFSTSTATEASPTFYKMFSDIGDELFRIYHGKLQNCEQTLINWAKESADNLYGEKVADVTVFEPLKKSGWMLALMIGGIDPENRFNLGNIITTADIARIGADNAVNANSLSEFLDNYIKDSAALFIKKAIGKGVSYLLKDQLSRMGVKMELGDEIDIDGTAEALVDVIKSNKDFIAMARQYWDNARKTVVHDEVIPRVTYTNVSGCKTVVSATWYKRRSKIVFMVNSECDCDKAKAAAITGSWTPIKEGSVIIIADVYAAQEGKGIRWKARINKLRYKAVCCDGGVEQNVYDIKGGIPETAREKRARLAREREQERQHIAKLCQEEHQFQLDILTQSLHMKRHELIKAYDKQIADLEKKEQAQQQIYKKSTKRLADTKAKKDAVGDTALSDCEQLFSKQESLTKDIRFQNEMLNRAVRRRADCRTNCGYIDSEIAAINKELGRLKQQRANLQRMEKACKKANQDQIKQLPEQKKQRDADAKKLVDLEKQIDQKRIAKKKALADLDWQYKQAKADLQTWLRDCKKSKTGKLPLPQGLNLKARLPSPIDIAIAEKATDKSNFTKQSPNGYLGNWVGPKGFVFRIAKEKNALVGRVVTLGQLNPEFAPRAGEVFLQGTVSGNIYSGTINVPVRIPKCKSTNLKKLKFKANLTNDRNGLEMQTQAIRVNGDTCTVRVTGWHPKYTYRRQK